MNTLSTTNTTKNFLDSMLRHGIGFDPRFFERAADVPNFPPHDIRQLNDDQYLLTLAVAGFTEDDIEIIMIGDLLTITGKKTPINTSATLLYSGIAFRDFSRQFKVGDHVYVESANLKDGLLQIDLLRRLPEAMKPKRIVIGAEPSKRLAA